MESFNCNAKALQLWIETYGENNFETGILIHKLAQHFFRAKLWDETMCVVFPLSIYCQGLETDRPYQTTLEVGTFYLPKLASPFGTLYCPHKILPLIVFGRERSAG
jgi:hypothetical protein